MINHTVKWPAIERIVLGAPAAEAIEDEARRANARRVFLLVSRSLAENTTQIDTIRRALGERFGGIHHGIRAHVPKSDVVAAAASARDARADLLVTVGGGSVTDAGKVVLLCLKHDVRSVEQLDKYRIQYDAAGNIKPQDFAGPDVRAVCVPTTLSGGEWNSLSGVTDEKLKRKQGFEHRDMVPRCVVLDPRLTVHTPDWLWLSTGVRALDHAVETLASSYSNAFHDGIADGALRLLAGGLRRVKESREDLEARLDCQIGAAQASLPLVSGVPMGASHAIGHLLGAVCDVPHGYTSCVMTPYVQAWNAEVGAPRQARISACLGDERASAAVLLHELIAGLGMPRTLPEVGVRPEHLENIATGTLSDIWGRTNPRPIESAADVMTLLHRAMGSLCH
jgi:maleylacetate reductase